LRIWVKNIEQITLDRLDAVYAALQMKQIRKLQGVNICDSCATTYSVVPEGSVYLKYSISEIICSTCLSEVNMDDYDTIKMGVKGVSTEEKSDELSSTSTEEPSFSFQNYVCECGEELESVEAFAAHRETCPKAGKV